MVLCQQTSPKRWFGNMNITSNCDVTKTAHHKQMTTICHRMKAPHENFLCTPLPHGTQYTAHGRSKGWTESFSFLSLSPIFPSV